MNSNTRTPEDRLFYLFSAAFSYAKRLWSYGNLAELFAVALAITAVFTKGSSTVILMIAIIALLITSVFLKLIRRNITGLAERIRTRHLLAYGFGELITETEVQDFYNETPDIVRRISENIPNRTRPYYENTLSPGPARLAAMLHESAFYSREMSRHAFKFYILIIVIIIIAFLLIILGQAVTPRDEEFNASFYQVLQASIAVVVSLGILETALTYKDIFAPLNNMTQRLLEIRRGNLNDPIKITALVWEYAVIQSHGQLVPDWLFNKNHKSIKDDWERCERDLHHLS